MMSDALPTNEGAERVYLFLPMASVVIGAIVCLCVTGGLCVFVATGDEACSRFCQHNQPACAACTAHQSPSPDYKYGQGWET